MSGDYNNYRIVTVIFKISVSITYYYFVLYIVY